MTVQPYATDKGRRGERRLGTARNAFACAKAAGRYAAIQRVKSSALDARVFDAR